MTTVRDGGAVVLVPRGHLHEGEESDALERGIEAVLARGGRCLVVDLSQTRHLSARSIGVLAQGHLAARARGGSLELSNVRPEHRVALEVTGLLDVIVVREAMANERAIQAA